MKPLNQRTSLYVVWAAVTTNPHASIRELGAQVGLSYTTVRFHLETLYAAGYIAQDRKRSRARCVLMPFYAGPIVVRKAEERAV